MGTPAYVVPNVPLIPQDKGMACWYASTQMLVQWRREKTRSTEMGVPDPSDIPSAVAIYKGNNGLPFADFIRYAKTMGLTSVPGQSPTLDLIGGWLANYGPIWAAGYKVTPTQSYGHVFVIAGVADKQLYIHDPEPMNVGTRQWVAEDWLTTLLDIGRFADVTTNFLYIPT